MDRTSIIVVWQMMMMMMLSWASARNMALLHQGRGQVMQSPFLMQQEEGLSGRVGSRPPGCEHKCRGCRPCSPIQVPTAALAPQYANYQPEGWKCHCGSIFFNP